MFCWCKSSKAVLSVALALAWLDVLVGEGGFLGYGIFNICVIRLRSVETQLIGSVVENIVENC